MLQKDTPQGETPATGKILIAEPFLKDPNFARSVILLCQHHEAGSFGFIINRLFTQTLDHLIPETRTTDTPVYFGGPVQLDTVHFIHRVPGLIDGGLPVVPGVYWGGDFERAVELLRIGLIHQGQIKFFIGYSGWDEGQLDGELKEHSWIVSSVNQTLLFDEEESKVWTTSLRLMGSEFAAMANYPPDPSLN